MERSQRQRAVIPIACIALALGSQSGYAQQISLAFSSVDSPNANWYIAKERQLFKKYGLDADLVFIPSSRRPSPPCWLGLSALAIFPAGRPPMWQ